MAMNIDKDQVRICIVRHGKTAGNVKRGYIGCRTDEDLCPEGRAELETFAGQGVYPDAETLYISPMKRCRQTAEIIWPHRAGQAHVEEDLRECDFGDFDGKSYEELSGVPDFQHWIDSDGKEAFPGGESPADFQDRSCRAFEKVLSEIFRSGASSAALAVHGGTIMSVMQRYADPGKTFYDWHVWNGDGFVLTVSRDRWEKERRFTSARRILGDKERKA